MGDAMAIRGHTEGGADAIVVAGGDAAIGKRLIGVSGKYRLICGMLSDLDDFDLRSNSTSPGGEGHGEGHSESLSCRDKAKADKHHQDELQHLVQSTDEILRQVYDSLPENGLFIISLQGGVHAKREGGSSEICAADNAAALLAIKV